MVYETIPNPDIEEIKEENKWNILKHMKTGMVKAVINAYKFADKEIK